MRASFCIAALFATGCATKSVPRQTWRSYVLGNVTVVSGASAERSDQIVENLRRFQVVVGELTTASRIEPDVPTRVYVFPDMHMYRSITGSYDSGGMFSGGLASNLIVMHGAESEGDDDVLFHEYTHLVVHGDPHHDYPRWYNEGLAEVLETVRFDEAGVHLGRPSPSRDAAAFDFSRWLPLGQIMREDYRLASDAHTIHRFYGQSWLLVHYAMFGALEKRPDRGAQLEALLEALSEGAEPVAAAEAAFATTLPELERELRGYIDDGALPYVRYPATDFAFPEQPVVATELAPAHGAAHLAFVAAWFGQRDVAVRLAWEAGNAGDDTALRSLALALAEAGPRHEAAFNHFKRARELAPRDAEVLTLYAAWLVAVAGEASPSAERARLRHAMAIAKEAIAAAPEQGAGRLALGLAALALGPEHASRAVESLTHAFEAWPGSDYVALQLGIALASVGEIGRARELFVRVARHDHGGGLGKAAREQLDALANASGEAPPAGGSKASAM